MSKKLYVIPPNMALFAIKDIGKFDNSHEWWDKWNDIIRMEPKGWDTYRKLNSKAIVVAPNQIHETPLKTAAGTPYWFVKLTHSTWAGYIIRKSDVIEIEIPSEIMAGHYYDI